MSRFANRLDEATYRRDELVALGVARVAEEPQWLTNVPERIFARLQHLASAYELHVLPGIEPYDTTRLNSEQCRSLREELEFLDGLSTDPLLRHGIGELRDVVNRAVTSGPPMEVVVAGP